MSTRSILTTLAEIAGLALISAGSAVIYWPAALIVAGIGLIAVGVAQS